MPTLLAAAGPAPAEFGWWLASRAAGVAAFLCIAVSVGVGLAMAGKVARRPLGPVLMSVHQHTALAGLVAIAVHGITLLGDAHLRPDLADIAVPFASEHEPLWTGLGVTGGWLAAGLALTYWLRDRIGPARWRSLHRLTILVYVLAVAHTLGAGTDAGQTWMHLLLVGTGAPILFLFVLRVLTPRPQPPFRPFRVAAVTQESATVRSFELEPAGRGRTQPYAPGQFLTVRAGGAVRSYSLSRAPGGGRYRISVKREPGGAVSRHLHDRVAVGDTIEAGAPAGRFVLDDGDGPVALVSAGIGVTPVLAMLGALAGRRSGREVWWLHCARRGAEHAFGEEARAHLRRLPNGRGHVRYSRPEPGDTGHDAEGRLTADAVLALGVPHDAAFHLCGTPGFVADMTAGLRERGVDGARITSEAFGGTPAPAAAPAAAAGAGPGPVVAFARSDVRTTWDEGFASLLELAEASAVPSDASCRIGACHGCRTTVLAGEVRHDPEPVAPPPDGSALLCCARPAGDLVLDA